MKTIRFRSFLRRGGSAPASAASALRPALFEERLLSAIVVVVVSVDSLINQQRS